MFGQFCIKFLWAAFQAAIYGEKNKDFWFCFSLFWSYFCSIKLGPWSVILRSLEAGCFRSLALERIWLFRRSRFVLFIALKIDGSEDWILSIVARPSVAA